MSKQESFSRYSLIIKKIRRNPSTFEEVSDYLALESELQSYNYNISKRTFQRDLEEIRSLFNVDIRFNFSSKVYYIFQETEPELNDRMLEAFDTFNVMNMSDHLSKFMHFEKRRPGGTENLHGLLHAIKNSFLIYFIYKKFWDEKPEKRYVEPYALKEFRSRWYLISKDLKDNKIKSFGLDRLSGLDITRRTFTYPEDFNVEEYFKYCFGIIGPEKKEPEEIILSFNAFQGKYIKTLPLHATQEILVDDENELRIKLKLFITYDLEMELLSYGADMKVLQPQSLADKIKNAHENAMKLYP